MNNSSDTSYNLDISESAYFDDDGNIDNDISYSVGKCMPSNDTDVKINPFIDQNAKTYRCFLSFSCIAPHRPWGTLETKFKRITVHNEDPGEDNKHI